MTENQLGIHGARLAAQGEFPTIEKKRTAKIHGPRLAAALVKAQGEFPTIEKKRTAKIPTKSGGSFSYRYADLSDVLAGVGPPLRANGLVLIFGAELAEVASVITATLLHASGESITARLPLVVDSDPQKTGSRITYLKRYLAGLLTGVSTDDDDDGTAGGVKTRQRRVTAPKPEPEAPPTSDADKMAPAERAELWRGVTTAMGVEFGEMPVGQSDQKQRVLLAAFGTSSFQAIASMGRVEFVAGVEKVPFAIVEESGPAVG